MKKSYHSIVVPMVLAITARRNCARCSCVERPSVALPEVVIAISFPAVLAARIRTLFCNVTRWVDAADFAQCCSLRPPAARRDAGIPALGPGGVAGDPVLLSWRARMAEEKSEATPRLERGLGAELHPVGNMARVVIGTIVVAGLYFARPVLEPIALAVLLSLLL